MLIRASNVGEYLAQVPVERQAAMERLRLLCLEELRGYQEAIEYGMPGYKNGGVVEVAFASQKQYISLYVMKEQIVNQYRDLLAGCDIGKGCIRFKKADQIDFEIVRKLLRSTAASEEAPC